MNREDIAGLILTGGRSTRMGRDKATLELAGQPMWKWAANALRPFVDSITLVGALDGFESDESIRVLADDPAGSGPLGGLATGLENSGKSHHLVVAADYPLVRPELIELLLSKAPGQMAVCGRAKQYLEPLVGYYHASCAPFARTMIAEGELRTHRLFERVASYILTDAEYLGADPDRMSQIDVDTPADADRVAELLRREFRNTK